MKQGDGARLFLVLSTVVTVLLYFVPYGHYVGYPLMLLSTLVHELGHGLAAVLSGGDFDRFVMSADGSGYAVTATSGRFSRAFVSAGGLVGPAIAAAIGFAMGRTPQRARQALAAAGALLLVALLLVVRSWFGAVFVVLAAGLFLGIAVKAKPWASQVALVFVAVQLSLSVFSRGDYLFTPVARTAQGDLPSDVAQMSEALFLPYWFWGAACGAFSVAVLVLGMRAFFRGTREA